MYLVHLWFENIKNIKKYIESLHQHVRKHTMEETSVSSVNRLSLFSLEYFIYNLHDQKHKDQNQILYQTLNMAPAAAVFEVYTYLVTPCKQ